MLNLQNKSYSSLIIANVIFVSSFSDIMSILFP